MSLIRANSNPEGLYVFGDLHSNYYLSTGGNWKLSNIQDTNSMVIPGAVFEKAARKWHTIIDDIVEVGGFKIESNVGIFTDTLEKITAFDLKEFLNELERPRFWGIKISYKDLYTYLYPVTWHYTIRRFEP